MKRFNLLRRRKPAAPPQDRPLTGMYPVARHKLATQLRHLARAVEDGQVTAMIAVWDGQVAGTVRMHPDNLALAYVLAGKVAVLLQEFNTRTSLKLAEAQQAQAAPRIAPVTPGQVAVVEKSKQ